MSSCFLQGPSTGNSLSSHCTETRFGYDHCRDYSIPEPFAGGFYTEGSPSKRSHNDHGFQHNLPNTLERGLPQRSLTNSAAELVCRTVSSSSIQQQAVVSTFNFGSRSMNDITTEGAFSRKRKRNEDQSSQSLLGPSPCSHQCFQSLLGPSPCSCFCLRQE